MKFTNLSNSFSIFGNFAVFDEDTMPLIQKIYSDCNIQINQEPNNKANPSGKVMVIVDQKNHTVITLRPVRIDVQAPNIEVRNEDAVYKLVKDIYNSLATILEGSCASRLAFVANFFAFDDDKSMLNAMIKRTPYIDSVNPATEISFRTNTPCVIGEENCNVVTNINLAMVGQNKEQPRNSIMVVFDCNTLLENRDERFELNNLMTEFKLMRNTVLDKIDIFERGI